MQQQRQQQRHQHHTNTFVRQNRWICEVYGRILHRGHNWIGGCFTMQRNEYRVKIFASTRCVVCVFFILFCFRHSVSFAPPFIFLINTFTHWHAKSTTVAQRLWYAIWKFNCDELDEHKSLTAHRFYDLIPINFELIVLIFLGIRRKCCCRK